MKAALPHLLIPMVFAMVVSLYSLVKYDSSVGSILAAFIDGIFFYGAPYAMWALFHFAINATNAVTHAGYIGATVSLIAISSVWLSPPDSSGLPLQWVAYWPLALMLMLMLIASFSSAVYLLNRTKALVTSTDRRDE